ncbi:MAG: response regulator [Armatimonadetes bacterium]|nr:response regulator [Armatimonadota bacterium]
MTARLIIAARAVAIAILILAVALILLRWRFPVRDAAPGESSPYWKRLLGAWRRSRRGHSRRAEDIALLRGKTALLIDPDPKSARVMRWKLEHLRCGVISALNGKQGLELSRGRAIDFIIVDSLLPDLPAVDFYNAPERPDVPIVYVGVLRNQWDEIHNLGGNVGLLPKPYDPEEAAAVAGRLLSRGASRNGKEHGNPLS